MDKSLLPAVIGAASAALVAVIGWLVVHVLSSRRDLQARRNAAARDHLEKQIERLYGPLLGLIQHTRRAFDVACKILPCDQGKVAFPRFSSQDGETWRFFVEQYFVPVNAKIRDLIRSNMHLLEAGILPESFEAFFLHEVQLEALHRLWKEKGVDTSRTAPSLGWPMGFESDVQTTLDELRLRHQTFLRRLGATGGPASKHMDSTKR
jgi:hypothetical protein